MQTYVRRIIIERDEKGRIYRKNSMLTATWNIPRDARFTADNIRAALAFQNKDLQVPVAELDVKASINRNLTKDLSAIQLHAPFASSHQIIDVYKKTS